MLTCAFHHSFHSVPGEREWIEPWSSLPLKLVIALLCDSLFNLLSEVCMVLYFAWKMIYIKRLLKYFSCWVCDFHCKTLFCSCCHLLFYSKRLGFFSPWDWPVFLFQILNHISGQISHQADVSDSSLWTHAVLLYLFPQLISSCPQRVLWVTVLFKRHCQNWVHTGLCLH